MNYYEKIINEFLQLWYIFSHYDYYIWPNNYPKNINTRKYNYEKDDLMRYGDISWKKVHYFILDKEIPQPEENTFLYLELFENQTNYIENPEVLSKKVNQKYLDFFKENFLENKEIIEKIKELWYIEEKIFFRELLSWDYSEIEWFDDEKLEKTIWCWKSELVPVIVFYNWVDRFCLELHYSWNPI
jgi:hypothetical protein